MLPRRLAGAGISFLGPWQVGFAVSAEAGMAKNVMLILSRVVFPQSWAFLSEVFASIPPGSVVVFLMHTVSPDAEAWYKNVKRFRENYCSLALEGFTYRVWEEAGGRQQEEWEAGSATNPRTGKLLSVKPVTVILFFSLIVSLAFFLMSFSN